MRTALKEFFRAAVDRRVCLIMATNDLMSEKYLACQADDYFEVPGKDSVERNLADDIRQIPCGHPRLLFRDSSEGPVASFTESMDMPSGVPAAHRMFERRLC